MTLRELDRILEAWARAASRAEQVVLATVVEVVGSAYRRPGARMLVCENGGRIGSISGGCLEAEVARDAWRFTQTESAAIRQYDTTPPEDALFGSGLGCNGVIRILLERLDNTQARTFFEFLDKIRRERIPGVVATVTGSPDSQTVRVGDRVMFSSYGTLHTGFTDESLTAALRDQALGVLEQKESRLIHYETPEGRVEAFVERVPPPHSLLVFGAGEDAIPLVRIAKQIGWHVTVVDWRDTRATARRFSNADAIVHARPDELAAHVNTSPESVAIVMNHNYLADISILEFLLARDLPYIGLLGPAARTRRMLASLHVPAPPKNLYAPAGLDIGADQPETIALAICAEIQAVLAGRSGKMLRERRDPIYNRPPEPTTINVTSVPLEFQV